MVRNLGIVDGFEVVQRRSRLGAHDFVWLPEQQPQEPEHLYDTSLFRQRLIRLHLRTDLFSRLPGAPGSGAGGPQPASAQLAPAVGLLPLSVKNISKASQPVLMYPRQLEEAAARLPAGVFMCYHPQLGLITDAMAQQYDVPALVAAHVGLPLSQAAAIRGALRVKAAEEAGKELRHVTQLKVGGVQAGWVAQRGKRRCLDREALGSGASHGMVQAHDGAGPVLRRGWVARQHRRQLGGCTFDSWWWIANSSTHPTAATSSSTFVASDTIHTYGTVCLTQDWNMMELLRQRMVERRAALEAGMGVGGEVAARLQELREAGLRLRDEVRFGWRWTSRCTVYGPLGCLIL